MQNGSDSDSDSEPPALLPGDYDSDKQEPEVIKKTTTPVPTPAKTKADPVKQPSKPSPATAGTAAKKTAAASTPAAKKVLKVESDSDDEPPALIEGEKNEINNTGAYNRCKLHLHD